MTAKAPQSGYTLIEVLIGLSLLAALSAAMAPMLFSFSRLTATSDALARDAETERTTTTTIRRLLAGAVWLPEGRESDAFVGTTQSMRFYTAALGQGLRQVELEVSTSSDGLELLVRTSTNYEPGASVQLMESLENIQFRYWGSETEATSPSWRTQWRSRTPPKLVRIDTTSHHGVQTLLRIEAATYAQAPLLCQYDQVSQSCRL